MTANTNENVLTLDSGETLIPLLESGIALPLRITGYSMRPFLKQNRDTVWLVKSTSLHRGQILFFRRTDGTFVLHRLRRICADNRLIMNGDAQRWCEIITPEQIVAVVCAMTIHGKKCPADAWYIKLRDLLWYPTRSFRPFLFRLSSRLLSLFSKQV